MNGGNGFREHTVFILNLPGTLDSFALGKLFQRFGEVSDVYIPKKVDRKSGQSFAFVRFTNKKAANEAIRSLNGVWVFGRRIKVSWARFQKPVKRPKYFHRREKFGSFAPSNFRGSWNYHEKNSSIFGRNINMNYSNERPHRRQTGTERWEFGRKPTRKHGVSEKWEWRPKKAPTPLRATGLNIENADRKGLKEVHGSIAEENLEWLSKSIVCISNAPLEAESLAEHLKAQLPMLSKFTDMGKYMFLLTFGSHEIANRVLDEKKSFLDNWFTEVRKWDRGDVCKSRRTWIELFGLPPLGWKYENIVEIAGLWGEVVYLNEDTIDMKSLEAACALIDTPHLNFIDDEVLFHLENKTYRVKILESRITVNTFATQNLGDSSEENTLSDPLVAHVEHSKTRDNVDTNDIAAVESDSPLEGDQSHATVGYGSKGLEHSSSRTWSDVVKGRKQSEDEEIAKEARETLEFSKLIGVRQEDGYEEAFLKRTERNIKKIREGKASAKNQVGGF